MNAKFAVDLRDYTVVKVECPDCHVKYQLRLSRDHSILAQTENGEIFIHCPACAKAKKLGTDNFEIRAGE